MPRLLLVDDDSGNRVTLAILLEEDGFEVELAASFREAESRISAPEARYDVVLLDQHLGDGLGSDLVPMLREKVPSAKLVLISGSIGEHDLRSAGFDSLLPKATQYSEILELIQGMLRQRS